VDNTQDKIIRIFELQRVILATLYSRFNNKKVSINLHDFINILYTVNMLQIILMFPTG